MRDQTDPMEKEYAEPAMQATEKASPSNKDEKVATRKLKLKLKQIFKLSHLAFQRLIKVVESWTFIKP